MIFQPDHGAAADGLSISFLRSCDATDAIDARTFAEVLRDQATVRAQVAGFGCLRSSHRCLSTCMATQATQATQGSGFPEQRPDTRGRTQ